MIVFINTRAGSGPRDQETSADVFPKVEERSNVVRVERAFYRRSKELTTACCDGAGVE